VLITKLRSANTAETRQYRKASKALLVLIPLFGLTYLIVLYGPNEGIGKKIFDIARAFLLSTQVSRSKFINSPIKKKLYPCALIMKEEINSRVMHDRKLRRYSSHNSFFLCGRQNFVIGIIWLSNLPIFSILKRSRSLFVLCEEQSSP